MTLRSPEPSTRGERTGRALNPDGTLLLLSDISKRFGDHQALENVHLRVPPGGVSVLIGPSGSGKSTLLRCCNLLCLPDSGSVWFGNVDVADVRTNLNQVRAQMGIVFQAFNLFPHKTVSQNIVLALRTVLRLSREEAEARAATQLRRVALDGKGDRYPNQLSGGQQQRVAIARALAMQPRLILFDEVTSALDPELVKEVLAVIRDLAADGISMVLATHELGFARNIASEVVFLDGGRVVECGPPDELFDAPSTDRLRNFLSDVL